MVQRSVSMGTWLVVLGVAAYGFGGLASPVALLPAAFGSVFIGLGVAGRAETRRRSSMHLAMLVAVLGIIGSIGGLFAVPALLSGRTPDPPSVVAARAVTAVILIAYLTVGIRSFIQARRTA